MPKNICGGQPGKWTYLCIATVVDHRHWVCVCFFLYGTLYIYIYLTCVGHSRTEPE